MAVSSFLNSQIVSRYGVRQISHFAVLTFTAISAVLFASSLLGFMPLWLFLPLLGSIMFMFGWAAANMNSLAMEPLGAVAGTASSVFGFIQTVGGALCGGYVGQHFSGTVVPVAAGYFTLGTLAIICVLIAERGRLFGMSQSSTSPEQRQHSPSQAAE
jgi:DHA1 family bicyclomycin/chloramphenicol resistance-like MFS transporter